VKRIWVATVTVRSTTKLAPATGPGSPSLRWASHARRTSPPSLAAGNRLLTDSPIQRTQNSRHNEASAPAFRSCRQARVSAIMGNSWIAATKTRPQPATAVAAATSPRP
jgi:hypothetical protein